MAKILSFVVVSALLLSACGPAEDGVVTAEDSKPYDGIAAEETIYIGGNEPFWGGEIIGETLRYTTPENPDGEAIAVKRFAGMNGLGFSGTFSGQPLDLAITPGSCSDGMSDRRYPYTATLRLGDEVRIGCAHTDRQMFTGAE